MNESESSLLISLKPRYADLIFDGLKKAELRRRDLSRMKGRDVYIYVTSPEMKLRGGFHVGEVFIGTPDEIWEAVSEDVGVGKPDFDAYYEGRELACALEITEVWEYENPLALTELRDKFENFVVPQSWRYARPAENRSFRRMKRRDRGAGGDTDEVSARTPRGQSLPLLQPVPA